jgi:hypothetical protein
MVAFTLTALQLEELQHKLAIVACEEDLRDGFELSQDEADDLEAIFYRAKPGRFEVTPKQARVIAEELENAAQICRDNFDCDGIKVYAYANAFERVAATINAQLPEA